MLQAGIDVKAARRNAMVLASAQALVGSAAPVAISTGGLAGTFLLDADKTLATLPVTAFNVGVAIGALPAAALMRAIGRRYGFICGTFGATLGGLVASFALFQLSFWLFALGLLVIGLGNAFTQQYRFAATDGAPRHYQSNAISIVLIGGMGAAVVGPQMVRFTSDVFMPFEFAGSFAGLALLGLAGAAVLSLLRTPPIEPSGTGGEHTGPARPLIEIVTQRRFIVALICGVGSFAMMSFVMTGAPLAIVGCGLPQDVSFLGIQWHVLAMFAPSLVTGRLINRLGVERVVGLGLILTAAAALVFLNGLAIWNFWLGLVLLGIGWNFGFIGATTMVAQTHEPNERGKTQGFHDLVLFTSVACASFLSGRTYVTAGWDVMNWIILPIATVCLLTLASEMIATRRKARAA